MKAAKFLPQLLTVGILSLGWITGTQQAVRAEDIFLLDLACVDTDGKRSNDFEDSDRYFSVSRQFFTSVMRAYPGAGMTCLLPKENKELLQLQFGLHDADSRGGTVQVAVYLDGQNAASESVTVGELKSLTIDVSGTRSVALQTSCSKGPCNGWLYFQNASVLPPGVAQE